MWAYELMAWMMEHNSSLSITKAKLSNSSSASVTLLLTTPTDTAPIHAKQVASYVRVLASDNQLLTVMLKDAIRDTEAYLTRLQGDKP